MSNNKTFINILKDISDPVLILEENTIIFSNKSFEREYGYSDEEISNLEMNDLFKSFEKTGSDKFTAALHLKNNSFRRVSYKLTNGSSASEKVVIFNASNKSNLGDLPNLAFQNASNAIVITDKNGNIQFANKAFTSLTGYIFEDIKGMKISVLNSGLQSKEFYKELWETIKAGSIWKGEIRNKRSDGKVYLEEQTITPIYKEGEITNFVAIKVDITEKKKNQKLLEENKERLNMAINSSKLVIYEFNIVERMIYFAWGIHTRLPFKDKKLGFSKFRNLMHPEDSKRLFELFKEKILNGKEFNDFEFRLRQESEWQWYLINGRTHEFTEGKSAKVIGTIKNIDKRKKSEQKIRKNLEFIEKLIEAIPNPVFYKNLHGKYITCNNRFSYEFFGVPKERILGKSLIELNSFISDEQVHKYADKDKEILRSQTSQIFEDTLMCSDKMEHDFLVKRTVIVDENDNSQGILEILTDITDLKRAENSVRKKAGYEKLIANISGEFLKTGIEKIDLNVKNTLKLLGEFLQVSRVFFLELKNDEKLCVTQEWNNTDLVKASDLIDEIDLDYGDNWIRMLFDNKEMVIENTENITEFNNLNLILNRLDASSVIILPIIVNNMLLGVLFLENSYQTKKWDKDIILYLRVIVEIISNAISKKEIEKVRIKTEEVMRKLSRAISQTTNTIIITDDNATVEYVNPQYTELTGYSFSEIYGQKLDLINKNIKVENENLWEYLAKGNAWRGEIKNTKKDGTEYWESISINPIRNKYGRNQNYIAIREDITNKKISEEKLKYSNRALDLKSNLNSAIVFSTDLDELMNKFCKILVHLGGYNFASIIKVKKKNSKEVRLGSITAYPKDKSIYTEDENIVLDRGIFPKGNSPICITDENIKFSEINLDIKQLVFPIKSKNSVKYYLILNAFKKVLFKDQEFKLVNDLTSLLEFGIKAFDDKSKRIKAEEDLSNERNELKVTLKAIDEGIVRTSFDGRILLTNEAANKFFNLSGKEITKKNIIELFKDSKSKSIIENHIKAINEGNQQTLSNMKLYVNTGNVSKVVLLSTYAFQKEMSLEKGIVFAIRDITDVVKIENQLALAQKMESIGNLAAGIAHEMNTPLQFVNDNTTFLSESFDAIQSYIGYTHNLLDNGEITRENFIETLNKYYEENDIEFLSNEIPDAISQTMEGLKRASRIVRAMKDFAHPGSIDKSYVNINKGIETTSTISRNEWKYVADLKLDLDETLPDVYCQLEEINQVILNMIVNSAHAIEEKLGDNPTEKGEIKINTTSFNGSVKIEISDSGNGIPKKNLENVFMPFFTTKEVGKGTGQGLAIAHDIIKNKHKGDIKVFSEAGKGTTFSIILPIHSKD